MSEDEQLSEIGRTFRALRDEKRKHGCQVAKAKRLAQDLSRAAKALEAATRPDRVTRDGVDSAASPGDVPRELPSSDEARSLIAGFQESAERIRSLELDLGQMQ